MIKHLLVSAFLLFFSFKELKGANMAANRVVYSSNLVSGSTIMITDTLKSQCVQSDRSQPYVVVDLGLRANLSSVVLWSNTANVKSLNGYKILGMDDWRTCQASSFFSSNNRNCGTIKISNNNVNVTLTVSPNQCYGRFFAFVNPSSNPTAFTLCEMEIYGSQTNPKDIEIRQNPYERQCGVNNNPYLALDLALGNYCNSSSLAGPESSNSVSFATDGLEQFNYDCFVTNGDNNYFVLDLKSVINISFVRLQNTYWDAPDLSLYEAAVTNNWKYCFVDQLPKYPLCGGSVVQQSPDDLWEWKTNGTCIGRFFILRSIDPIPFQWLKICEIEVYGTVTNVSALLSNDIDNSCDLIPTGQNIAFGQTAQANINSNLFAVTDGVLDQSDVYNNCFYSYWADANYVVVNLGAVYNIQTIKIWNSQMGDGNAYTIDVSVGQSLRLQYMDSDVQNFNVVGSGLSTAGSFTLVHFKASDNITGQYIMIKKQLNYLDSLIVCELEVTGTIVPNMPPNNQRPTLVDQNIPSSSIANFPISSALRAGVSYLYYQQYSAPVISGDPSSEGIMWLPSCTFPIAVAGKYGLGKYVAFGKAHYFDRDLNTLFDPIFKTNLYNWLSPNFGLNARIISSTQINSSQAGDIVYFDITSSLPSAQQQKLLNDLQTEKVSVVIETTYWAEEYYGSYRANYDFLVRALLLDFSDNYLWDSEQQFNISNNDFVNYDYTNFLKKLGYLAQNDAYLLTNALDIMDNLEYFTDYLITNATTMVMKAILDKYLNLITFICPGVLTPMGKVEDELRVLVFNRIINNQAMSPYALQAPCVDLFPGIIPTSGSKNTVSSTLTIVPLYDNEIHSTGLYLAAGQTLKYVTNSMQGQWMIAIGCHTDELIYKPTVADYHWIRYPIVHTAFFDINNSSGTLYSPFGGVVWIQNVDIVGPIQIQISGVQYSPFFNIRDPNADNIWLQRINSPGLWTEIMGQYVVISAPSNQLQSFDAPTLRQILKVWDEVIAQQHVLCGTNATQQRRERITIDTQITYGYGHAGYPIMTSYPWFPNLFSLDVINTPDSWGVIHELGHQRQQMYYTFTGTLEVTVNIFPDFLWSYRWGIDIFSGNHEKFTDTQQQEIIDYMANGAQFSDWQSNYDVAFMIYAQLGHHFGFGLYQQVLTNYTIENPSPADDQAIIDLWVTVLSDYTEYNLLPLYDFWGIPVSDNVRNAYSSQKCFLPYDPIAVLVPSQYQAISSQYNNKCDTSSSKYFALNIPQTLVYNLPNDITMT